MPLDAQNKWTSKQNLGEQKDLLSHWIFKVLTWASSSPILPHPRFNASADVLNPGKFAHAFIDLFFLRVLSFAGSSFLIAM